MLNGQNLHAEWVARKGNLQKTVAGQGESPARSKVQKKSPLKGGKERTWERLPAFPRRGVGKNRRPLRSTLSSTLSQVMSGVQLVEKVLNKLSGVLSLRS